MKYEKQNRMSFSNPEDFKALEPLRDYLNPLTVLAALAADPPPATINGPA
jgi:hypothetical protein